MSCCNPKPLTSHLEINTWKAKGSSQRQENGQAGARPGQRSGRAAGSEARPGPARRDPRALLRRVPAAAAQAALGRRGRGEGARQSRGLRLNGGGKELNWAPPRKGSGRLCTAHQELPQLLAARAELSHTAGTRRLLPAGLPAGCSAGTSRPHPFVFAYLGVFGTALGPPLRPQVPPPGPAEQGAAPQATRGGCADAEGARPRRCPLPCRCGALVRPCPG